MTRRFATHCLGLAALASLLLIPGRANAACADSVSLSYGSTVVSKAGGVATVAVIAPPIAREIGRTRFCHVSR